MTETSGPSVTGEQQHLTAEPPPADQPGPTGPQARPLEELRRSRADRKIAGVAGGLGRHLGVDPTIVRVVLVVLCFFGGAGFVLYAVGWLLVPEDGRSYAVIATRPGTRTVLLISAGVVALLLMLGNSWTGTGSPWPLVLVGGVVLGYLALRERRGAPPAHDAALGVDQAPTEPLAWTPGAAGPGGVPPWQPPTPAYPPTPARPLKRGPLLFGPTLALVALALGALGAYDATGGSVASAAYPALALALVGAALVVGSVVGRAGGLILLGVIAAGTLGVTSILDAYGTHPGGSGERLVQQPLTAGAVESRYSIDNGKVLLDLRRVRDPRQLLGRSVEVAADTGELVVLLPRGVATHVDADIDGPGQVDVPGHSGGGIGTEITTTLGAGPTGDSSAAPFSVRAHLFAGHIDVRTR